MQRVCVCVCVRACVCVAASIGQQAGSKLPRHFVGEPLSRSSASHSSSCVVGEWFFVVCPRLRLRRRAFLPGCECLVAVPCGPK